MKLTRKQVAALVALVFTLAAAYGMKVSPEVQSAVSNLAVESVEAENSQQ